MRLSEEQLRRYEDEGYLFFPSLFSRDEIETVKKHLFNAATMRGPGVTAEEGSTAPRAMMGVHLYDAILDHFTRHPRLLVPSLQIAGEEELAMMQSRVIVKSGIERRAHRSYPWHQDFSTWYLVESMKEPRPVVIGIFLDEITACNAPMMIVPKSHRRGLIARSANDPDPTGTGQIIIDGALLGELVAEGGIVALTGPPGSAFFMHANAVHASNENISPLRRAIFYVVYNPLSNPCASLRGGCWVSEQWTAATPSSDDCLMNAEPVVID
jgi:ectoine hydroxylase